MDTDGRAQQAPGSKSGGWVEPSNPALLIKEGLRRSRGDPVDRDEPGSTMGASRPDRVDGREAVGERSALVAASAAATNVRDLLPPASRSVAKSQESAPRTEPQEERAVAVGRIEASLVERYLIKRAPFAGDVPLGRTEYRYKGDASRIAFTESAFKLATDTNSPSVARSMVDVAQAREWHGLRVSGHDDFKRMVWLEATVRGVKSIGYEPSPADLEVLQREQESRRRNRIEPAHLPAGVTEKGSSGRGGGGRKTVLAAIEAILVAKRVPEARRNAVMSAAAEKLAERMSDGRVPKVRIYEASAPSRRPAQVPNRTVEAARERVSPTR